MVKNKTSRTIRKCGRCGGTIANDDQCVSAWGGKEFHSDCAIKDMQTRAKKIVLPKSIIESARETMFDLGWFNLHKYKSRIKLDKNLINTKTMKKLKNLKNSKRNKKIEVQV